MPIKTVALGFDSLQSLDGGLINQMLREHLKRAAQDCIDRPQDSKERIVSLDFKITPVMGKDRECDKARIAIECKSKVPVYRTTDYEMRPTLGGFLFNEDFPDELNQIPLPDSGDE